MRGCGARPGASRPATQNRRSIAGPSTSGPGREAASQNARPAGLPPPRRAATRRHCFVFFTGGKKPPPPVAPLFFIQPLKNPKKPPPPIGARRKPKRGKQSGEAWGKQQKAGRPP